MTPLISICISSSARLPLLSECLKSISTQDFPRKQLEVFVALDPKFLVTAKKYFDNFDIPFHWLPVENSSSSRNRNEGLQNAKEGLVYFLDEDCSLPTTSHLKNLLAYHQRHHEVSLIGGRYSNGELATRWGQAYNLVCNSWQDRYHQHSLSLTSGGYVGGNLSIKLNHQTKNFRFGRGSEFGGEEAEYVSQLQANGHQCLLVNGLTVNHHAQHDMKTFFSRAWLHGQNKRHPNRDSMRKIFKDRKYLLNQHSHFTSKSLATLYIGCAQISWLTESTKQHLGSVQKKINYI